jgi:hypothetical protein
MGCGLEMGGNYGYHSETAGMQANSSTVMNNAGEIG